MGPRPLLDETRQSADVYGDKPDHQPLNGLIRQDDEREEDADSDTYFQEASSSPIAFRWGFGAATLALAAGAAALALMPGLLEGKLHRIANQVKRQSHRPPDTAAAPQRLMMDKQDEDSEGGFGRAPCVWHRSGRGVDACNGQGPLTALAGISIEDCRDGCNNDPLCSGITFDRERQECSMWEEVRFARDPADGSECQWCQRVGARVMESRFAPVDGAIDRSCEEHAVKCVECCSVEDKMCGQCLGYDPSQCSSSDCLDFGNCDGCGCAAEVPSGAALRNLQQKPRKPDGDAGIRWIAAASASSSEQPRRLGDTEQHDPAANSLAPGRHAMVVSTVASLDDCKDMCIRAPACQGIGYRDGDGSCTLMTQLLSSVPKDGSTCMSYRSSLVPMDGGLNRACRGRDITDMDEIYFDVHGGILALEDCKILCLGTLLCSGIEYDSERGSCKVWWGQGVHASAPEVGKTCLKYVGPSALGGLGLPGGAAPSAAAARWAALAVAAAHAAL